MKTDDPRLEASLKELLERIKNMDVLTLAVIKGHLLLEQAMDDFIAASVFHPEHVQETRFSFMHKAKVCLSLCFNQNHDRIWDVVWQANSLRNMVIRRTKSKGSWVRCGEFT